MKKQIPKNIDVYIAGFPDHVKVLLSELRTLIKNSVPQAEETISYGMPTFKLHGHYLLYFAGYKNHIGVYPVPTENEAFEKEFSRYKTSGKGTIQFQLDKPLPETLIKKIIKFRVSEVEKRIRDKKK